MERLFISPAFCNSFVFIPLPLLNFQAKFAAVKLFFAFILSLIVLTETVVPCCLWDNCNEEEIASSHEEDATKKAACSPFAACATCTAVVLITKPNFPVIVLQKIVLKHTAANPFFVLSSYQHSFLQPPRLS